jgi:hypothetical protein
LRPKVVVQASAQRSWRALSFSTTKEVICLDPLQSGGYTLFSFSPGTSGFSIQGTRLLLNLITTRVQAVCRSTLVALHLLAAVAEPEPAPVLHGRHQHR